MRLLQRGVLLLIAVLLAPACGSASDPGGGSGSQPLVIAGDTTSSTLKVGDADTFRLVPSGSGEMAVFLQAQDSNVVELTVEWHGVVAIPTARASYLQHASLEANRTMHFPVVADSTYSMIIRAPAGTAQGFATGRYRFRPTLVDTLPESGTAMLPLAADL